MNHTQRLEAVPAWSVWNPERLQAERDNNPRAFARGFQMMAFTDDERMFPSFPTCLMPGVPAASFAQRGWPVFMGVDLAGKNRPGNVIFIVAVDPLTQRRYPLEILAGAWTSPETARQLAMAHSRHPNTRVIMVENNGYQQAIIDWIKNSPTDHSFWFKIESFTTGANKVKPEVGLPSLEVEFKNKAWVIPHEEFERHTITCHCGWCTWNSEMRHYPMSASTDTVMGCWFAREAVSRWGVATPKGMASLAGFNDR